MCKKSLFKSLLRLLFAVSLCCAGRSVVQADELPSGVPIEYWRPILDEPQETYWDLSLTYHAPVSTSAANFDDLAAFELSGWTSLIYYETYFGADFDIRGQWDSLILQGYDGTSSGYPLTMARISAQYSQRLEDGWGVRAKVEPGIYSALQGLGGEDLAFPVGLYGTYAYDEYWEWIAGLNIYPGFDRVVDPEIGVRYAYGDQLEAHLGYPESRLTINPYDGASFDFGARFWAWPEFQMDEDDERERLMYDESRIFGSFKWSPDNFLQYSIEIGYLFNREIEFEKAATPIDIDDGFMIGFGIGGLL